MFLRFRATPQVFLIAFLLDASFPSCAIADSWGLRTDFGVAAVDRKTGKVQWEVWQRNDIPENLSKASKAAVVRLLPGAKGNQEFVWPTFPAALGRDRVVDYVLGEESGPFFVLAHGKPKALGAEIARFEFGDNARWRCAIAGDKLFCLRDSQVEAYVGTTNEDPKDKKWTPSWTFDLFAGLPEQKRAIAEFIPMDLHVNREGVWVVHGPRILQLTPEGLLQAQYKLKHGSVTWFDHYVGTPLTFGKHLIYYRSTSEVIALDWRKKREIWRLSTTLAPNVSKVIEIEEDRALVQIGSDVPPTIQNVLASDGNPRKKPSPSTRERVAAARLLHSYGDGYLRKELREYREQLRKKKADAEAKQAGAVLDDLLATWPRKRDRQRLLNTCVSTVLQGEKKESHSDFASLAGQRLLTWSLLRDEIGSWHGDNEAVAKLIEHCRHILATGPKAERPFAASVLLSRHVGWFRLTDSERKGLFLSRDDDIWQETAESLVMNGWREELVKWASERPAADQPDILLILSRHEVKKWSKAERKLWLIYARDNPGRVAYLLYGLEMEGGIPVAFREPIRSYLEKEIAKPTVKEGGGQEASDLVAALYVLDRWKKPEDTELLRKFLKHPYEGIERHIRPMVEKRDAERPPGSQR